MRITELLKKLSEAAGAPGFESSISTIIKNELKGHVDSIKTDTMGNLIVEKGSGSKSLMISAHMDEISLIVKHVNEKGFIRFAKLGGVTDHILPGNRVLIQTKRGSIPGVIGCKPIHIMKDDERRQLVTYDKMFIDIGAHNQKEAKAFGIDPGDAIVIDRNFVQLKNNLVCGKGFDNRVGCAILTDVLKTVKTRNKIYGAFTVQEEVGIRGAIVSAYSINPDYGIAVDTTIATDHPEISEHESPINLGFGPAILVADGRREGLGGGMISHPMLRNKIMNIAKKMKIPIQLEIVEGGTTDATAIHLTQHGVPSCVISIPSRYIHSTSEVVNLKDVVNASKLLRAFAETKL